MRRATLSHHLLVGGPETRDSFVYLNDKPGFGVKITSGYAKRRSNGFASLRPARLLRGDRATHRRAMHQAALGHVVVLDRPVLDHAVVPHQHVARAPLMAIHERGLDDVIRQGGDQRLRLVGPYLDAGSRRASRRGTCGLSADGPHDGMANRWVTVDFRLRRRQGPLASAEIEHGSPSLQASLHRIRQGVPGRSALAGTRCLPG